MDLHYSLYFLASIASCLEGQDESTRFHCSAKKIVFVVAYFLTLIFLCILKNYIFIQFNFSIFNVILIMMIKKKEFRE